MVPTRLKPVVFGCTVYAKLGEADVVNDFDTTIQFTFDFMLHPHPEGAVVFITNVVPDASIPTLKVIGVTDPGIKFAVTL
jgi:hypothetical protein